MSTRMQRGFRASAIGLSVSIAILCAPVAAGASGGPGAGDGNRASAEKVLPPGALTWQEKFDRAATVLRERFPETFAEAVIEGENRGRIAFKGALPAGARTAASLPKGASLVAGAQYSERELEGISLALLTKAEEEFVGAESVASYLDWRDRSFHVVRTEATQSAADKAATARAAEPSAETFSAQVSEEIDLPDGFGLVVEAKEEPIAGSEAYDGGDWLMNGDRPWCTAAFPVKKRTSAHLGVLTAGHCPGNLTYTGNKANIFTVLSGSLSTNDGAIGGDFRWFWSSQMFSGRTYVGAPTAPYRNFSAAAKPSVNSTVCKYGGKTGYGCAKMVYTALYYSPKIPDGGGNPYRVGPLGGVASHITTDGDSGGPWFYNYTAYGIHSGFVNGGSAFSYVTHALSTFDLVLWAG
ncbi:hypothetical protein [Cellulomonas humilata]|uniref:Serine protease n=1 Tax=Cellulomonas humilata TaxID=144055 RepID=A0ABU0EA03_9CELL|nr:hypothetical protein [Cellulomonas humilata]MDQ0372086.1 hypothetical protein [Cellulomonas humilata]